RPHHRALESVTRLERGAHHLLLGALGGRRSGNRLVQSGIERGSHWVDALHSRSLELTPELAVPRAQPVAQAGEGRGWITGDEAIEVVKNIEQLGHEAG